MRLFYQLSEKEQNDVIHHCADLVIEDLLEDGLNLNPISEEDFELQERLEGALQKVAEFTSEEEKVDYLLNDEYIHKAIYDIALEMAKSAFYHEDEELVIYPDSVSRKNDEASEEDKDLPTVNTVKKKPSHSIN